MRLRRPFFLLPLLLILQFLLIPANGGRIHAVAMVVARTKLHHKSPTPKQQPSTTSAPPTAAKSSKRSASPSKTLSPKQKLQSKQTSNVKSAVVEKPAVAATTSWRSASTIGEAVQLATSVSDLLDIASTMLWLPTDPNLPVHFKQSIHHDRRQRWSSQLLCKLGDLVTTSRTEQEVDLARIIWQDERLARAVLAAAYPHVKVEDMTEPGVLTNHKMDGSNHGKSVRGALVGLATLAGKVPILSTTDSSPSLIHPEIVRGIRLLLQRAEAMAGDEEGAYPLQEICEMRWASRGLLMRLGPQLYDTLLQDGSSDNDATAEQISTSNELLSKLLPRMQERVKHLPFDILPMGVLEWSNPIHHFDIMDRLQREIPFLFDTITTRNGASVTERRGTAWVTEPGIGALAYSGKLMIPTSPLPTVVQSTMRLVEAVVEMPRNYFDCALCNHYPTGDAACQFHTDPEHGTMWERASCVVAMGDPRRFAFRPIPQLSTWQAWDTSSASTVDASLSGKASPTDEGCTPAIIQLFPGDIVQMWGTCNDDFHHAVYPGDISENESGDCLGRISLVLKRAMVHKGNRRGHGLPGEGRRSRR